MENSNAQELIEKLRNIADSLDDLVHYQASPYSLRAHLAAHALQGFLAGREGAVSPKNAATRAVQYADALIAELDGE